MGRKRSEPNASADHRSDACAIGSRCDGWSAGVDDRAAINVGRTAAVGRRGDDERRESGPMRIGQIGRILGWRGSTAHVVAYEIAPHQNGMVAIMIPHIRFSDRPLPPRTHFPSQAASLSAPGGLRKARSSAPSGNVLKACQKVAGPGIGLTARKPKAGDASNIF
jgi:hypothetical protein